MTEAGPGRRALDCMCSGSHRIVAGRRIWVLDLGEGPTVVFLHGNPSSSFSFRHQIAELSESYRVIAPDLFGFGASESCPDGASFLDHAALFEALADRLRLEHVHLVLHDWGGPIGLHWAVAHSSRVARLVLANTTAGREIRAPRWWSLFTAPLVGELTVVWTRFFVRAAGQLRSPRDPGARCHYRKSFPSPASRRVLLALERLRGFDELMDRVERLGSRLKSVPCLILWGEPEVYFRGGLDRLRGIFPRAEIVRIQGGGHFLFERRPDEVSRRLLEFFDAGRATVRTDG